MWTIDRILRWGEGAIEGDKTASSISGFSIDTRTLRPGEIFIALKGSRSDGHQFVEEAFRKGASGAMVSHDWFRVVAPEGKIPPVSSGPQAGSRFFILVDDPLIGIQSLARWHRREFRCPIVAITGSNGKTTTKEMLANILRRRGPVLKNEGNLNNHIGLPLSLLRLSGEDHMAVLEMGISRPGDMKQLSEIAKPTVGLITNIGPAHLEFLGDLNGVAAEKQALFEAVASDGIAIINRDDPYLKPWEEKVRDTWTFSIRQSADVTAADTHFDFHGMTFTLKLQRGKSGGGMQKIILPLFGEHQVYNAMAASAVALALGYEFEEIREGLRRIRPVPGRGEVIPIVGATILLDAYNANPASMEMALRMLNRYLPPHTSPRKIAILGDMLELGEATERMHREVGKMAVENRIDRLIAVGQYSALIAQGAREGGMPAGAILSVDDIYKVDLSKEVRKGDIVLIKGSRGMKMERLLYAFSRPPTVGGGAGVGGGPTALAGFGGYLV